jgi:hypothetical protein
MKSVAQATCRQQDSWLSVVIFIPSQITIDVTVNVNVDPAEAIRMLALAWLGATCALHRSWSLSVIRTHETSTSGRAIWPDGDLSMSRAVAQCQQMSRFSIFLRRCHHCGWDGEWMELNKLQTPTRSLDDDMLINIIQLPATLSLIHTWARRIISSRRRLGAEPQDQYMMYYCKWQYSDWGTYDNSAQRYD